MNNNDDFSYSAIPSIILAGVAFYYMIFCESESERKWKAYRYDTTEIKKSIVDIPTNDIETDILKCRNTRRSNSTPCLLLNLRIQRENNKILENQNREIIKLLKEKNNSIN
jgi:hypothetical protein